ncbi:hypothetical protein V8F20_005221 [Naviculisporaceae sp. PSN 640]
MVVFSALFSCFVVLAITARAAPALHRSGLINPLTADEDGVRSLSEFTSVIDKRSINSPTVEDKGIADINGDPDTQEKLAKLRKKKERILKEQKATQFMKDGITKAAAEQALKFKLKKVEKEIKKLEQLTGAGPAI